ncbi:hypothetical protein ACFWP5_47250 [Streptomyces sp. NPDC058469]|uniref:hypothetical protein n=1 Tax=Streptomyces sp. NPDC058469 TaxID=3346514 RepID=UPI0036660C52
MSRAGPVNARRDVIAVAIAVAVAVAIAVAVAVAIAVAVAVAVAGRLMSPGSLLWTAGADATQGSAHALSPARSGAGSP